MYRKDTYKIKKKKMEEKKMRKTHRTKALIATTVAAAVLLTTPVWADEAKKDTKEKYKVGFVVQILKNRLHELRILLQVG